MAFLNESFDVATLPQSDNSDPLPAGWYSASITGAELKNAKTGGGQYIAIKYSITGPTHQGRVVFGNINIRNQNPEAERIGRQQLGDMMRAIGLARVQDTDQLIGGNLQVKLSIRKSDEYGDSNDVKAFKPAGGAMQPSMPSFSAPATAPQQQPAQQPQAAPAVSGNNPPPWLR